MSYNSSKYSYPSSKQGAVFSGGYVDNTPNTHLADNFSPYLRNGRLDGASIINRPWHETFVTVDWTDYPRWIFSYLRASSANDRIVVRQNVSATEKLVSITEAWVKTNITTASNITSDNRMVSVNIGDVLYLMNGTDFGKLSWTTYTDLPISSNNLPSQPAFGVFFAGCLWVAGFAGTNSNKVYKSPNNTYEDFTAAGSDEFTFPEQVTGMMSTSQAIFVFTKNTVHVADIGSQVQTAGVITFSFRPLQATEWAICNASLVAVGSNAYYLSSSNKLNMLARGSSVYGFEVVELSDRKYQGISTLMNSLATDQSNSFAQYYPEQSLIKWFFRSNWATFNDVCVIYDVEKDMFLRDTNKYFYDATYFNGQVYTVSNLIPSVHKDEYGNTDDGGGIDFEFWTKAFDEWEFTLKKCYWESRTDVSISELAVLTQEIWLNSEVNENGDYQGQLIDTLTLDSSSVEISDWGIGTQMTGSFAIGTEWFDPFTTYNATILRTKGNLNKKGYSIQFRYYNNAIGSSIKLRRLGYKVEVLPSITSNLTMAMATLLCTEALVTIMTESGNSFII